MLGTLISFVVMHQKIRRIRLNASRDKKVFLLTTNIILQLAGITHFPPVLQSSFEAYQLLTTNRAQDQGLVCHRKCYLLTKDKIYDAIYVLNLKQNKETVVLVNISVVQYFKTAQKCFSLI